MIYGGNGVDLSLAALGLLPDTHGFVAVYKARGHMHHGITPDSYGPDTRLALTDTYSRLALTDTCSKAR